MIFKICETSLNIQNSIVHNLLNSSLILINFVSKFMVCKVLYFEAQYVLGTFPFKLNF